MAGDKSTFDSFCFTEDNRIVVLETVRSRNQYSAQINTCLKIFDLQTNKSTEIKLSKPKDNLNLGNCCSICMYDAKLVLIAADKDIQGIMVVDMQLQRHCRTIYPNHSKGLGSFKNIHWISCKGGKIFILAESRNGVWLCLIDFNGTILSELDLPATVAAMDYDGLFTFFYTDRRFNDIFCISIDKESTSKCYSSLDLKAGCNILYISGNELLLLEEGTNTVYKLDFKTQRRSILIQNEILKYPSHFNMSLKFRKYGITMDEGKRIRIFTF